MVDLERIASSLQEILGELGPVHVEVDDPEIVVHTGHAHALGPDTDWGTLLMELGALDPDEDGDVVLDEAREILDRHAAT